MSYRSRYNHRRKMGYSADKARRMAKSGCYVATCVYGSYDCPEVWTLRRYQEEKLAISIIGRVFVRCYYFISPIAVNMFGEKPWFKRFFKTKLDRFVHKLNAMGYDNSPYKDK